MADLTADQAKAHLALLGYYPVRYTYAWAPNKKYLGVRNERQVVGLRYGTVHFEPRMYVLIFTEIEWWVLTDETIIKLAKTIDNELIGW